MHSYAEGNLDQENAHVKSFVDFFRKKIVPQASLLDGQARVKNTTRLLVRLISPARIAARMLCRNGDAFLQRHGQIALMNPSAGIGRTLPALHGNVGDVLAFFLIEQIKIGRTITAADSDGGAI